ncbi:MAG: hypothetical protein WCG03_07830 [Kiritimatiellales bacterium]
MSLIQDALKRQAEENAGTHLPEQPIGPLDQPPEKKKNKALPIVPLILFLVVFLVALLGLSLYLIRPKLKTVPKVTRTSVPVETVALPAAPEPAKVLNTPVPLIETKNVELAVEPVTRAVAKEQDVIAEPMLKIKRPWPELKLTGIAQGDRQSLAILNGKMLSAGRKLGEVTIIEVRDGSILVEYKGERRTLYIGE